MADRERRASIRIRASVDSQLGRALRGVTSAAAKSTQDVERAQRRQTRVSQDMARESERASVDQARAGKQAAQDVERAQRRQARTSRQTGRAAVDSARLSMEATRGLEGAQRRQTRTGQSASRQVDRAAQQQARSSKNASRQTEASREAIEREKQAIVAKSKTAKALAREELRAKERAARDAVRANERASREEKRIARDLVRAQERAVRDVARVKERAARAEVRDAQRAAQRRIREEQRVARAAMKQAEATKRSRRSALGAIGGGGGLVAVGAGLGVGAGQLIGRGQGVAGVGSLEERVGVAGGFQRSLVLTANEANLTEEEQQRIQQDVVQASKETNIPIEDFAAALMDAQQGFDALRDFAAIVPDLATIAAGKDIPLRDVVNVLGTARTGLGLNDADSLKRFADILISTSERGSVEAGAVARDIGPIMAQYAIQTGRTGIVAASELLAFTQTLGKFQPGQSSEIATQIEALLFALKEKDTQEALRKSDIQIFEDDGKTLRGLSDIAAQFAASGEFEADARRLRSGSGTFEERVQTIGKGGIFGRKEAQRAAVMLMTAVQDNPEAFLQLQNIQGGLGLEQADKGLKKLQELPFFKLQNIGITAQAETLKDLGRIVEEITPAVKATTELQSEFPLMTEALKSLETAVWALVGALGAAKLFGGAGAPATATAATTAAGALAGPPGKLPKVSRGMKGGGIIGLALAAAEPFIRESGEDLPFSWLWNDKAFENKFGRSSLHGDEDDDADNDLRHDRRPTMQPGDKALRASLQRQPDRRPASEASSAPRPERDWKGKVHIEIDDRRVNVRQVESDDERVGMTVDSGMRSTQ